MILAIDQGTTGTTCLVFDVEGRVAGRAYSEFEQHFPRPGWVEHDAMEIWEVTRTSQRRRSPTPASTAPSLEGIGITNQRETVVAWDPGTGEPVHNALVWQDRRTAARCDELREAATRGSCASERGSSSIPTSPPRRSSGCCGTSRRRRDAAFGTIDSWLIFKLTGRHVTDYSNASRTMLFDIRKLAWDEELCDSPRRRSGPLPEPAPSAVEYGTTTEFGGEVPVAGIAGDQQAALFGQLVLGRGWRRTPTGPAASSC